MKSHGSDRVQVSDTTDGGEDRVCVIRTTTTTQEDQGKQEEQENEDGEEEGEETSKRRKWTFKSDSGLRYSMMGYNTQEK